MRTWGKLAGVLGIATCLGLAAAAQAVPGQVVRTWPLDLRTPTGLTWDGSHLWVADYDTATLNEVDPATGRTVGKLDAPGYAPMGLAWDGRLLWVVDSADKTAYAIDTETRITERALPLDTANPEGIAWDGRALWTADAGAGKLSRLDDSDGTTFKSLASPTANGGRRTQEIGLAFDGDRLYVSDRVTDTIYRMDPNTGAVMDTFPSPGPYAAGLAWDGSHLWNVDYETRTLYELVVTDPAPYVRTNRKHERVRYTEAWRNFGPGVVKTLDLYIAVPVDLPSQQLLKAPEFTPKPTDFVTDQWGQKCAHYRFTDIGPGRAVSAVMKVDVDLFKVRWHVDPDKVGTLDDIPADIRKNYTLNNSKLVFDDPVIQNAVREAVGDEANPYWIAWKINRYIQKKMHYELAGGWNIAPTVLSRGSGSCSEYTFVMLAMCHAAGLPARYAGSVVIRGDDASRDDVFHRWVEVYLPGYGWFPVDPSGGDSPEPAGQAAFFGELQNRFLITTLGAGGSRTLGWDYDSNARWTALGRVKLMQRKDGEWTPVGKKYETRAKGEAGGLTCKPGP